MRFAPISLALAIPLLSLAVPLSFAPACGSSGLSCENPTSADQTCLDCLNSSCSSDISSAQSGCSSSAFSCVEACNCGDLTCQEACSSADAGTACTTPLQDIVSCGVSMCASQCKGAVLF
jgi:hypothetical protein